jgi:hypothetical protein
MNVVNRDQFRHLRNVPGHHAFPENILGEHHIIQLGDHLGIRKETGTYAHQDQIANRAFELIETVVTGGSGRRPPLSGARIKQA